MTVTVKRPSAIEKLAVRVADWAGWLTFVDGNIIHRFSQFAASLHERSVGKPFAERSDRLSGASSDIDFGTISTSFPIQQKTQPSPIEAALSEAASDAANQVLKSERRMNLYVVLGIAIGFAGLAVFYLSVGSLLRFTNLLFLEAMAWFFLRQYRLEAKEYKHFLSDKHRIDLQMIAYLILKEDTNKESLVGFAKNVLAFDILPARQTATRFETDKPDAATIAAEPFKEKSGENQ
ncbi:MAG TPA: hypothetical protein VKZ53_12480 [Candidatus Angelobacter sp.]|nr:hypothetical protein [Candidatus Angelobacter sp.]